MNNVNRNSLLEVVEPVVGDILVEVASKAPDEHYVCVHENLEASGWAGKWTEPIRKALAENFSGLACVCVKPIPYGQGRFVSYKIRTA